MPHILVAGRIHKAGTAVLEAADGFTFELVDEVSLASYSPLIGRADAVLIRTQPMPASVIAQAPNLKIVSRHGVGYDSVDVAALNARGIPLVIAGDVNSKSVAEHTLMMMLNLMKRASVYDRHTRTGDWNYRNSLQATELGGKTLFLLGFGRIGRHVARLAQAFDMKILAYDPFVDAGAIALTGATPIAHIGDALAQADVISVHIPLASEKPLIGAAELARMKPTAIIINTARGGIIDEDAMAAALNEDRLGGAGLDVFSSEPPDTAHSLFHNEHTLLTPHAAGLTEECAARMAIASAQNILDFFNGRLDPSLVVNPDAISPAARKLLRA